MAFLLKPQNRKPQTENFCDFISEKGRLEGTSEIFEKNKVQREKWPVPSNGPPVAYRRTNYQTYRPESFLSHFQLPV